MSQQDQRVGEGAQGYQAGRDLIIQPTVSLDQMSDIWVGVTKQVNFLQSEAMRTIEDRLKAFRVEILTALDQPGKGDLEAFRDPDFQCLVNDAQNAYARSGDVTIKNILVDIIARRSLERERNRLTITLNNAAAKVPNLTNSEFSELSLIYVMRYVIDRDVIDHDTLFEHINKYIVPLLNGISREKSSYWHLEAQSCATSVTYGSAADVLRSIYGGLLSKGFSKSDLSAKFPKEKNQIIEKLLKPCLVNQEMYQIDAVNKTEFHRMAGEIGIESDDREKIWTFFEGTMLSDLEIVSLMKPHVPEIESLFDLWDNTPIKGLALNSVGIAIAHANVVRLTGIDATLDTWIK